MHRTAPRHRLRDGEPESGAGGKLEGPVVEIPPGMYGTADDATLDQTAPIGSSHCFRPIFSTMAV